MKQILSLKNLIAHVTPNTLGIIWAVEKELHEFPPYFIELDYLLDGQLKKQVNQSKQEPLTSSLFVNQHFLGKLYILAFKTVPGKKIADILEENKNTLNIMKKSNPTASNLIFLAAEGTFSKDEISAQLKKRLPEITPLIM